MDNARREGRFDILDGLRGIAAVTVMLLHFCEPLRPHPADNWFPHGYLAVDFFFCLSGFVLAHAYDGRTDLSTGQLLTTRLIRLHPMVIVATVLGLFSLVPILALTHQHLSALGVVRTSVAGMLLVPDSFFTKGGPLFLYAPPAWSLFSEYLASAVYVLLFLKLDRRWLALFLGCSVITLVWATHARDMLEGGWEMKSIQVGLARVAFSFTLGVLLYRSRHRIHSSLGFPSLGLVLMAVFLSPHFSANLYFELAVVAFLFPLIILIGADGTASPKMAAFCAWMGNLSYPLYLTHYFFVHWFTYIVETYHPTMSVAVALVAIMSILAMAMAQFILVQIDMPARAWLKKELQNKRSVLKAIRGHLTLARR